MERLCFFCHKPLPVELRATVFCSQRCQELEMQLRATGSLRATGNPPSARPTAPPGAAAPAPNVPPRRG